MPIGAAILAMQAGYSLWAGRKLLSLAQSLPEVETTRHIGNSHGNILGTFQHIYYADRVWLNRLQGEPQTFEDPAPGPSLEDLERRWLGLLEQTETFASHCDPMSILAYRNLKGNPFERPFWQVIFHIVNHATYHRGQVASMMKQLGHQPPATDAIIYYIERFPSNEKNVFTSDVLSLHAGYAQWASRRLLSFALTLPGDEIVRQIGNSHGNILRTFQHIYYGDRIWLNRLVGTPRPFSMFEDPAPGLSLAELENAWWPLLGRLEEFSAQCDPSATLTFQSWKGGMLERPHWQIVSHVINHGTYHRGQIASLMRQLGHQPPSTDLIYYYLGQ